MFTEPRIIIYIGIYPPDGGERIVKQCYGPTLDTDAELIQRTVNFNELEEGDYIAMVSTPGAVPRLVPFNARLPKSKLEVVL